MKFKFIISIGLTVLLAACGSKGNQNDSQTHLDQASIDKIINGITRSAEDLPQFVKVYTRFADDQYGGCTGTVVNTRSVLTAAHCVMNAQEIVIQLGDDDNGRVISAESYSMGAGYDGTDINDDIALVAMREDIGLPVLPLTNQGFQTGEPAMIVGFGLEDGENGSYGTRRSGTVYITDATQGHWVAQYDGNQSNPCFGDSGGPLIKMITDANGNVTGTALAGVVSAGTHPTCGMGDTTFYTRIDLYIASLESLSSGIPVI